MKARIRPRTDTLYVAGRKPIKVVKAPLGRKAAAIIAPFTPAQEAVLVEPLEADSTGLIAVDCCKSLRHEPMRFPKSWWDQAEHSEGTSS